MRSRSPKGSVPGHSKHERSGSTAAAETRTGPTGARPPMFSGNKPRFIYPKRYAGRSTALTCFTTGLLPLRGQRAVPSSVLTRASGRDKCYGSTADASRGVCPRAFKARALRVNRRSRSEDGSRRGPPSDVQRRQAPDQLSEAVCGEVLCPDGFHHRPSPSPETESHPVFPLDTRCGTE